MNKKLVKKIVAATTSVATTLSVSGVSLLMPFMVSAVTISEGDTIKTAANPDVYIVKLMGSKMFKRLILNPQVFESYGHLSWSAIKTVTQAEMDVYTVTTLVRAVGDPKVYSLTSAPNSDTGIKSWLNMTAAEFVAAGYDWDSIYQINGVDRDNYTVTADTTPTTPTPTPTPATGTGVTVKLASDTPIGDSVAMGAQNHAFAKINFTGNENTTVTKITVTRSGLANDSDLSDVKLWDGSTQIGSTQALNTTTHKAVFSGLSWVVPAGLTKVLTISGSIAGSGTAATSTAPRLGIAAAADIVVNTSVNSASMFPATGNAMTIAGLAIGRLNVTTRSIPAASDHISGSTDQEIGSWTFAAVTEGMSVRKVKITQVGTASISDLSNVKLKINGVQIGSTVATLATNGTAEYDLSGAPVVINADTNKIIYAYADLAAGLTVNRTVNFEITNAIDVTAFGQNSGGSVTITGSAGAAFTAQTGAAQTITRGTVLSVTSNGATNPSAQTFVRGASQVLISAFRFSNGAGEDQRVVRVKLSLGGGSADATDISNVTLYKYDETAGTETQVGTPTSFVGTIATYGSNSTGLDTGLFDVLESKNVVIHVRADVSSAASWTGLGIFLNEARVDGVKSQADIGAATITAVDTLLEMTTHLAHATVGVLTMAVASANPSAQNVVPGTTGFTFGKFDLTMAYEDATLSSISVNLCDGARCGDGSTIAAGVAGGAAELSDFTNVKLWNGATQLGTTVAAPSTIATFSVNLNLPKDKTVTLTVTADVPTNAASSAWLSSIGAVSIAASTTAPVITGVSSNGTVLNVASDARGNAMTATAETVTVGFQTVPATTLIVNASQAVISRVVLTAGSVGDVKVNSIKFTAATNTDLTDVSSANSELGSLKLFSGTTQLSTTKSSFTDGGTSGVSASDTVTFTGVDLTIPKGTSKVLDLKADVLAATDVTIYVGIYSLSGTSDVVATGLSSNTTIYGTGTASSDSGAITLTTQGTLTVGIDAGSPVAQFAAVGTAGKTGVEFAKFKFTANNEAIEIESLEVTLEQDDNNGSAAGLGNNDVPNIALLNIYNGATKIGGTGYYTGSNDTASTTVSIFFNIANDELIVPKDGSVVLTVKADLNGTSNGANSSSTPRFHLADVSGPSDGTDSDVRARGVSSGARVTVSRDTTPSTDNPETASNVNNLTIVRSKPVVALCTASNCTKASPSGSLVPGVAEVIRFRIDAVEDDVIFTSGTNNIRFNIAQSGGSSSTARNADLYEVGKTTALQTVVVNALGNALTGSSVNASTTINFQTFGSTIPKGTPTSYKEYYVNVDLTDYATTGETFKLSIEETVVTNTLNQQSPTFGFSWGDGVTTNVTSTVTTGLPLTGNTLTR